MSARADRGRGRRGGHGRSGGAGRGGAGRGGARKPQGDRTRRDAGRARTKGPSSRALAMEVLHDVERGRFVGYALEARLTGEAAVPEHPGPGAHAVEAAAPGPGEPAPRPARVGASTDRFVRELVLGVLRRRLTLDAIVDAYARRPAESLDGEVRQALRVGLHQLVFMDGVPPYAAVGETVAAVRRRSARAFVNGLLRAIQRGSRKVDPARDRGGASPRKRLERPGRAVIFFAEPVFADPQEDRAGYLAQVHAHPRFLVERWLAREEEAAVVARLVANNEPQPTVLWPRTGRLDAAGLVERLAREGVPARLVEREHGEPAVAIDPGHAGLFTTACWREGLCTVQSLEQRDAVDMLDPRAGEVVWDACAAPGGKTAQLTDRLDGEGLVVATDADEARLARVHETAERLGLTGLIVAPHDVLADEPPPARPDEGFDAILLDVPCSNTAVLGRRPDVRWRLRPDVFSGLAAHQARLIEAARRHLRPGGRLVYSTCSLEPEENEAHGLEATAFGTVWVERS